MTFVCVFDNSIRIGSLLQESINNFIEPKVTCILQWTRSPNIGDILIGLIPRLCFNSNIDLGIRHVIKKIIYHREVTHIHRQCQYRNENRFSVFVPHLVSVLCIFIIGDDLQQSMNSNGVSSSYSIKKFGFKLFNGAFPGSIILTDVHHLGFIVVN
jgi:hypothetical protein